MNNKKLPEDFAYLKEMYADNYFPNKLVDKIRNVIREAVKFIENSDRSNQEVQEILDKMTLKINGLQEEFDKNGSEIETVARDSIGITVENILNYFEIDIDPEEAIREREW
jgi:hypothetical protein